MTLKTDYLIIGSGAVGMAFVDTLLVETDAHITIVDRYAKPGGHWNVAYPFVSLHQPSQFYGVSSKELSKGRIDEVGLNKGLYDLASGAEISGYYDEVMRHTFLPTGRVDYYPLCDYKGDGEFESLINGKKYKIEVNKKIVDTTHLKTAVPATHTPNFTVSEGVSFMPINDLPKVNHNPEGFVIIGGGKTGIDACLWLLENQVDPDRITWIVSRDAWLINRERTQPSNDFFMQSIGAQGARMEAIINAKTPEDIFDDLEKKGVLVRIDPTVRPKMLHGATISPLELEQMRRIKNVVRMGRVQQIEQDQIVLDKGTIPTSSNHVHVDCSASAVTNMEIKKVFDGDLITLQPVRSFQPVFSAALIAFVEANYKDDQSKNKLCQVVPLPNSHLDWIGMMDAQLSNQFVWAQDKKLRTWVRANRLDGFGKMIREVDKKDPEKMALLKEMRKNSIPTMIKLQRFIREMNSSNQEKLETPQLQVKRNIFFKSRLVDIPASELKLTEGEVRVKIQKFAYTANNITYAAAGDRLGYWKFFPAVGEASEGWGVIPVWGFAEVVESTIEEIPVGDRLFGYFPPAKYLKMTPKNVTAQRLIDGTAHRTKLPAGYNLYSRVNNEKGYHPSMDNARMLLSPLYMTSFFIRDTLQEFNYHDAQQVLILSASSKTSIGLGYALQEDESAPKTIGITSKRNLEMVQKLELYDTCLTYDTINELDSTIPTIIVDMSGNNRVLSALHTRLGDQMILTYNVGITHWTNTPPQPGVIRERSKLFFAPGQIQKRLKEWGPKVFQQKTTAFLIENSLKTTQWLTFKKVDGLEELMLLHPEVCMGTLPPNEGLIVEM